MIGVMSAGEVIRLTKLGPAADGRLGKRSASDAKAASWVPRRKSGSGAGQMAMLRRLPKLLRFIPGPAQDLQGLFPHHAVLVVRIAGQSFGHGPLSWSGVTRTARAARLRGRVAAPAPKTYPEIGLYHPRASGPDRRCAIASLPTMTAAKPVGTVGVLVLRSYVLAEDAGHYDGVIAALEAQADCAPYRPSPAASTPARPSNASS